MEEVKPPKSMPTPDERPDLYDAYDCQERKPLSAAYLEGALPDHIKAALASKAESPA